MESGNFEVVIKVVAGELNQIWPSDGEPRQFWDRGKSPSSTSGDKKSGLAELGI